MTLELRTFNVNIIELLVIQKCMEANPDVKTVELAKILGIGKSTLYRKLELLQDPETHKKFAELGYSISYVTVQTVIQSIS